MDRGLSEEGVDSLSDLFLCSEHVSFWINDFLMMASTFLSVALIHSVPMSSELLDLVDFLTTDRKESAA